MCSEKKNWIDALDFLFSKTTPNSEEDKNLSGIFETTFIYFEFEDGFEHRHTKKY